MCLRRGGNRLLHVLPLGRMPVGQHVTVVVRHDRLLDASRPYLAAADDDGDLDPFACHLRETPLQLSALGRTWQVAVVGLVDRRRNPANRRRTSIERHYEKSNAKCKMQNANAPNTVWPAHIRRFVLIEMAQNIITMCSPSSLSSSVCFSGLS